MSKPRISFLSESEIEAIHDASLRALEKTGIKVMSKPALDILKKAGAKVDYETGHATLHRNLVEEALKMAPKTVKYCARNPKYDFVLDKKQAHFATDGFDAPFVSDWETGERRASTNEDLARWVRIADYLDSIDDFWISLVAGDIPVHMQKIGALVTSLSNTEKHITYEASNAKEAKFMIEIVATIVGGKDEIRKGPIISVEQAPVSPLTFEKGSIEAAIEFAKIGIPVLPVAMPLMGATAPATLAGAMTIANAEFLAELVILEFAASSGAPVLYAVGPSRINFSTGGIIESPESLLLIIASTELGRYYDLPCASGYAGNTSSKVLDAQAGYEKGQSTIMNILAGLDIIPGCGELDDALCMSPEALVIDSEIIGIAFSFVHGFEVNDDTLALNIVDKVGPAGHFLGEKHTLEHYKRMWMPMLSAKSPFETWVKQGSKTIEEVAKEKVREILATHKPTPLPEDVDREISRILKRAEAELT
jgi:trimethylamine--corrinoid protein Co-methyltransferase